MQNRKIGQVTLLLGVFILLSGFLAKKQSFKKAIEKFKETSVTHHSEVGKSLPFFTTKTLTPTWNQKEIVKIPKYSLMNQNGEKVNETLFDDKTTIVGFIFTSCAGFCPTLVQKMQAVDNKIGRDNSIQFVLISVDPEIDTHERLKKYAAERKINISKNWTLLTGSKKSILSLSRNTFSSEIRKIEDGNMRKFAHTEHFYIIDKKRRLRSVLNGTRIDMPETARQAVHQLAKLQTN